MTMNNHYTQRINLPGGGRIDIITLSLEAARQAETNRQLQEAGITLTPEQETYLRQTYSKAINSTLMPEQQQAWQQYLREQAVRMAEQSHDKFSIQRNRVDEAQQWEVIQQLLIDASIPLTSDQEARMQQIHEQIGNQLEQEFQANPMRAFIELLSPFFLPEWIVERIFGSSSIGNALSTYITEIDIILTPEQKQVWERYWSHRQENQYFRL